MTAPKTNIDFIPKEDWEKTSFGKALKWLLVVGRYIVIFTELIVIVVFLLRFKYDRQLSNLHEETKRKQAIIEANSKFESDFRILQSRLITINGLREEQLITNKVLANISSITPLDVYFSNISVSKNSATFNATALSEAGLATFVQNLKKSREFDGLSITKLSTGTNQELGIKFDLKSDLKK